MPTYYRKKESFEIIPVDRILRYIVRAGDSDFKFCIAAVWLTGARINEIVKLKREDVQIDNKEKTVTFIIHAQKHGKIGYPMFSFTDPFIKEYIIPMVITGDSKGSRILLRGKRRYQQRLQELNKELNKDSGDYITFHQLRHSRITFLMRIMKATNEEMKSWTGHRSSAFEDYAIPRRVERFRGKIR